MSTTTAHATHDVRRHILATGQRLMAGRGFSAVGLSEILLAASVPKGSFYHYFESKDAFGEALLETYFEDYLAELDVTLSIPGANAAQRLLIYCGQWRDRQSFLDCQGRCLAVKLAAEVADLSDAMRGALRRGTGAIIERLRVVIEAGVADRSLAIEDDAAASAESLYQLWLGASLMAKIVRTPEPFESAMATTRRLLRLDVGTRSD